MKFSIVIITLNEQTNIERCLKSVQWADEIVIYDSGSSDRTIEIAKGLGANVTSGPWLGFGPTKKAATLLARNDWILSLDADEEISALLAEEIQQLKAANDCVYCVPRLSNYLGQWVHHGGWYPDYQKRLFNKEIHNWNMAVVHETIEAAKQEKLVNHLNHYVFKNIQHHIETNNRYSSLLAKKMSDDEVKFSWFHFFTKPSVKFLECYFLKLGFLDGWIGYFIAKSAAYSVFLKWAKLKEMEN